MHSMFFFLVLLTIAQAAPAPPVLRKLNTFQTLLKNPKTNCKVISFLSACDKYVNLNVGKDFNLPHQSIPKNTSCRNDFILPTILNNVYASGYILLTGMKSDDVVSIQNGKYDNIRVYERTGIVNVTLTFPSSFYITIYTGNNANLQVSMYASMYTATPKSNIVKSYVTFDGSASVFLYNNEWKAGESYKFSSKVANIAIQTAVAPNIAFNDALQLTNILIYDRDNLMGTLYHVMKGQYISVTNEVTLYKVKATTFDAATLITDYANVMPIGNYAVSYMGNIGDTASFDLYTYNTKPAAITFTGAHDGSTAVDLQSFTFTKGSGQLSYASGGPTPKSSSTSLDTKHFPAHLTGYANTVYLSAGSGKLSVKATKE